MTIMSVASTSPGDSLSLPKKTPKPKLSQTPCVGESFPNK